MTTFMKPKDVVFDDRYYEFNTDTKVTKIMFPLNKTLVLKINKQEFRYDTPIYSIWSMTKVSEEINRVLKEHKNIKSVSIKMI